MFESASGRTLSAAMPHDRVVPESDGPFAQMGGKPVMPWSAPETAQRLSEVWQLPVGAVADLLANNGANLRRTMGV
jgi:TatD DNase family protein